MNPSKSQGCPGAGNAGADHLRPDACRDAEPSPYNIARQAHAACMVCGEGDDNYCSLGLAFTHAADGAVTATFAVSDRHQGYDGILHGGMISTLLDAAMTHCLFAHGVQAVTAELTVRFVAPVTAGGEVALAARVLDSKRRTYRLEARMTRGTQLLARATGKFIEMKRVTDPPAGGRERRG